MAVCSLSGCRHGEAGWLELLRSVWDGEGVDGAVTGSEQEELCRGCVMAEVCNAGRKFRYKKTRESSGNFAWRIYN